MSHQLRNIIRLLKLRILWNVVGLIIDFSYPYLHIMLDFCESICISLYKPTVTKLFAQRIYVLVNEFKALNIILRYLR